MTDKRFTIVDTQFISYYGGNGHKISNGECAFWLWHSEKESQKVCDKLNNILDENEQLTEFAQHNYSESKKIISNLQKENEQLKSFIKELTSNDGKIWLMSGYGYRTDKILNDFNNTENDDGDVK